MIEPPPIATNGNDAESKEIEKEPQDLKGNNRSIGGRENGLLKETKCVRKFKPTSHLRRRGEKRGMVETL